MISGNKAPDSSEKLSVGIGQDIRDAVMRGMLCQELEGDEQKIRSLDQKSGTDRQKSSIGAFTEKFYD